MNFSAARKLIERAALCQLRTELENGLSPNLCNKNSWTLLMIAALSGNTRVGKLLIDNGADLDKRNRLGETALSLGTFSGHLSFVRLLLRSGASLKCHPYKSSFEDWLNWVTTYGRSTEPDLLRNVFDKERKRRSKGKRQLLKILHR